MLGRADERGVDVRGLVWRSHLDQTGFFASENRHLGERLQKRGAEVLLDMRVRTGGSHHQKFVVIRHRDDPTRDVAFVGGIDLAHNRRDDADHGGDPQPQHLTEEYGDAPAVARRAGDDPAARRCTTWRPSSASGGRTRRRSRRRRGAGWPTGSAASTLARPAAGAVRRRHREAGPTRVQLLRTYPNLRHGRDYPFARGGERSVARGYSKADAPGPSGSSTSRTSTSGATTSPSVFAPHAPRASRAARWWSSSRWCPTSPGSTACRSYLGRARALETLMRAAPGRVAAYGIENHAGTPVYVHAKVCVIDDVWASTGSDNFNRRSWTHDSELSAVVLDDDYARRPPAHAGRRAPRPARRRGVRRAARGDGRLRRPAPGCTTPTPPARPRLEAWHAGGRSARGPRAGCARSRCRHCLGPARRLGQAPARPGPRPRRPTRTPPREGGVLMSRATVDHPDGRRERAGTTTGPLGTRRP